MNTAKSLLMFALKFCLALLVANLVLDLLDTFLPIKVSDYVYNPLRSFGFGKPASS